MVRKTNSNVDIEKLQDKIKKLTIKVNNLEKNVKTNKKEKKYKDPNAPKKNINNYLHFYNEFYKEYLNKNKNAKTSEIGKLAGEEWKKIKENPKKKKKYDDMAIKDKIRYEKEMNEYKK